MRNIVLMVLIFLVSCNDKEHKSYSSTQIEHSEYWTNFDGTKYRNLEKTTTYKDSIEFSEGLFISVDSLISCANSLDSLGGEFDDGKLDFELRDKFESRRVLNKYWYNVLFDSGYGVVFSKDDGAMYRYSSHSVSYKTISIMTEDKRVEVNTYNDELDDIFHMKSIPIPPSLER